MTTGVFRRIFIIYAVIILLAGVISEIYIASVVRETRISNLKQRLIDNISIFSENLHFNSRDLDSLCRRTKELLHARVTVIASDGRVIGDSDHDSATMDNHAGRIEIQQASDQGTGMTIRYSETLKYDLLYVAVKIIRGASDSGFVRLAVPLRDIDRSVNVLRLRLFLVVAAVLLITWGMAVWQTEHLRRLLKQITDFSRSLSRGQIEKRLFLSRAGEFNEIADNLTSMSVRLQGVISEIEEERNRLNVILRSVPDALLILDSKGFVILSSSSVRDFFGDIQPTGLHFAEIIRNHEFTELIDNVRKNPSPGTTEFSLEAPAEKYLAVRVSPLFYRGQDLQGFIAIFHDVTEMKKLEQVRKDFVANVSHELKTPITAIRGFADTLLEGALDDHENAAKFVQTIRSNSERINSLVDDLMVISRIELGVTKIEKTAVDIEDVFENISELFRGRTAEKGIKLNIRYSQEMTPIEADRDRLIQILTNLVDNSFKFTETGSVTLGVDKTGKGQNVISVEDTGIGVPAKFISRLGERFFRVDPARSRKMGGTGLGLAIVKHLVKAHGWHMEIESSQGKGTTVRIFV